MNKEELARIAADYTEENDFDRSSKHISMPLHPAHERMLNMAAFRGEKYFLSNFYPCSVEWEGITYPSSEHAFVAAKTKNMEIRKQVAKISTAAEAKRFGREIPEFRKDWNTYRLQAMEEILTAKFDQNAYLKSDLLATGDEQLVETNHWGDKFWGVCDGVGTNHLGRLLMLVRARYQDKI